MRATAVKLVVDKTKKRGRTRQEARAFTSFRGYYLFESHFWKARQGKVLFAEIIFVSPQDNFFVRVVWISLSSRIEYCSKKKSGAA
jgi:hypothetical protein